MMLSIIIPTKDRGVIFEETLKSAVNAIDGLDAEIIVVNDSKNSQLFIPSSYKNVSVVNNPKEGVAAARNLGAALVHGQLLLFIDDDIVISKESVLHVISLHNQFTDACFNLNWEYSPLTQRKVDTLNFGRFLKTHRLTSFKGWYNDPSWRDNQLFQSKSVASFHLSIMKSDFEKAGGYNEKFPHAGFEDYDFPLQLKKIGLRFYIDTRVTVYHNEVDRLGLVNWLNSQEKRAVTRKKAVGLGYKELSLSYSVVKKMILRLFLIFEFFFFGVLHIIPNKKIFDPLYFKILSWIQASRIFKGYTFN